MSSEKSKYPLSSGKGELHIETGRGREKGDKEMKSERDRVEEREKKRDMETGLIALPLPCFQCRAALLGL